METCGIEEDRMEQKPLKIITCGQSINQDQNIKKGQFSKWSFSHNTSVKVHGKIITEPQHDCVISKSLRRFFWAPKTHVKIYGQKNIYNFTLKIFAYLNRCGQYSLDRGPDQQNFETVIMIICFIHELNHFVFDAHNNHLIENSVKERSGTVLVSRLKGSRFKPHRRHCVVSLSKTQ